MKTFKVGNKVKILSYNNWETVIEKVENGKFWCRDEKGELHSCIPEEMELVSEYNKSFNPDAHSSLIVDFDAVETIEEAAKQYVEKIYAESFPENIEFAINDFIKGAKSDATRNYWYQKFIAEQYESIKLSDIRNKLNPIANLIAVIESSELMYHHDNEVHKLVVDEIEVCKKSIEYLSSK